MKIFIRTLVVCFFTFAVTQSSALLSGGSLSQNGSEFFSVLRNAQTIVRIELPKRNPVDILLNRLLGELKVSRSA